jgi:RHS repeat-associated protein
LQEEGYYPFGLEMKAISSSAAMKMQTRYKFNGGTELETSFDVDYYETYFRQYDAQIGRFTGVDALAEKTFSETPYHFAGDNPINFNDPSGAMKQYNENNCGKKLAKVLLKPPCRFSAHSYANRHCGEGNYQQKPLLQQTLDFIEFHQRLHRRQPVDVNG